MDSSFSRFGLATLVIGALGVAGPIAWDYYKTKSALDVQLISITAIIQKAQRPQGLEITYSGQKIENLNRATFAIRNAGRTPILDKEVVAPLYIGLENDSKVIDAKIDERIPKDINASASLDKQAGKVTVRFDLLNPGDSVQLGVLFEGEKLPFTVGGRITGVANIAASSALGKGGGGKPTNWTVVSVLGFSIFSGLMTMMGAAMWREQNQVKKELQQGVFDVPLFKTRDELKQFISSKLFFIGGEPRKALHQLIESLPDADPVAAHKDALLSAIQLGAKDSPSLGVFPVVFLILAVVGFAFGLTVG